MTFTPAPKPLPRVPRPRKPLKAVNVHRSADEFTRCYHSEDRVVYVQSMPCIVPGCARRDIECAHVGNEGIGRKSGYAQTVPACRAHHRTRKDALHALARDDFEAEHMVDLRALAADVERMWRRYAVQRA